MFRPLPPSKREDFTAEDAAQAQRMAVMQRVLALGQRQGWVWPYFPVAPEPVSEQTFRFMVAGRGYDELLAVEAALQRRG